MRDAFGVEKRDLSDPVPRDGSGPTYSKAKADEWAKQGYKVVARDNANGRSYMRPAIHPNVPARTRRPKYGAGFGERLKTRLIGRDTVKPDYTKVQYQKGSGKIEDRVYQSRAVYRAKKRVSKADKKKELSPVAVGAATAGGAMAGQSAYMFPGSAFKNYYVRPKFDKSRANWTKSQKKSWFKHTTTPGEGFKPDLKDPRPADAQWRTSKDFFRKFPTDLPTGKTRRVMGYAFKGKTGHAVAGTMMAGGAAASYKVATHKKKDNVSKAGTYVPKGTWSLKLLKDPGLMVPVAGVTTAGVAGTAFAMRKKKVKKK